MKCLTKALIILIVGLASTVMGAKRQIHAHRSTRGL